jgi:hypothetical protein
MPSATVHGEEFDNLLRGIWHGRSPGLPLLSCGANTLHAPFRGWPHRPDVRWSNEVIREVLLPDRPEVRGKPVQGDAGRIADEQKREDDRHHQHHLALRRVHAGGRRAAIAARVDWRPSESA